MDKLIKDILELTKDNKVITEKQLFKLLINNHIRFNKDNYDYINLFLKENNISLTSNENNVDKNKKIVLAK